MPENEILAEVWKNEVDLRQWSIHQHEPILQNKQKFKTCGPDLMRKSVPYLAIKLQMVGLTQFMELRWQGLSAMDMGGKVDCSNFKKLGWYLSIEITQ